MDMLATREPPAGSLTRAHPLETGSDPLQAALAAPAQANEPAEADNPVAELGAERGAERSVGESAAILPTTEEDSLPAPETRVPLMPQQYHSQISAGYQQFLGHPSYPPGEAVKRDLPAGGPSAIGKTYPPRILEPHVVTIHKTETGRKMDLCCQKTTFSSNN